jgi:hypothetical protein
MRRSFNERLYADHFCADGVISSGWRKVKKGGRIKFGGAWYANEKLRDIEGELVHIQMGEYWQSYVIVHRGVIGCMGWFCTADVELENK